MQRTHPYIKSFSCHNLCHKSHFYAIKMAGWTGPNSGLGVVSEKEQLVTLHAGACSHFLNTFLGNSNISPETLWYNWLQLICTLMHANAWLHADRSTIVCLLNFENPYCVCLFPKLHPNRHCPRREFTRAREDWKFGYTHSMRSSSRTSPILVMRVDADALCLA